MREALNDFDYKNRLQIEFIEKFRENREWIFSSNMHSQIIKPEYIEEMRNSSINVNRIIACYFKFPICMNIDTFLMIQAQKIFSLFNCPNCKYTWMLFRKYLLEMILESWSLLIDKSDRVFATNPQVNKSEYLETKSKKLYNKLCLYLPEKNELGIIETFMWIFKLVLNR
ncbi:hypothetical protein M9Y10_010309 [Tritrichomonas musculus]|uniref:Uncharacterized protein n=1 Tax=Tritrichomonas musculus TaxID=1915356 RepID=A0ABR2IMR5_9EUKA